MVYFPFIGITLSHAEPQAPPEEKLSLPHDIATPPKTSHKTVLLVHTGHDVEHLGPEDNEGKQSEVHRNQ